MAEYIEREAVKEAIGFINLHFVACGEEKSLLDVINEVPAADVAPVVRCKECKHQNHDSVGRPWCDMWEGQLFEPDCFCYYGQRRDGDA